MENLVRAKPVPLPGDAATAGLHPAKGNKNQTDLNLLLSPCLFFCFFFFNQLSLICLFI